jgi:hypothetical protein
MREVLEHASRVGACATGTAEFDAFSCGQLLNGDPLATNDLSLSREILSAERRTSNQEGGEPAICCKQRKRAQQMDTAELNCDELLGGMTAL